MNSRLSVRSLFLLTVITFIPTIVIAEVNLTPEQLVLLMKASREQYNIVDAKMKERFYQYDPNNQSEPKVKMSREIVSRWTRDKQFSRTVETSYPDKIPHKDYSPTIVHTYVTTSTWSKLLIEAPDNRIPRGYIKSGVSLEEEKGFYTIYDAMWKLLGFPWEKMNLAETTVTRDEKTHYYIMKARMGDHPRGPFVTLYIDPGRDFIPVKKEMVKPDGTIVLRLECNPFRRVNGLWIAYRYCWFDPRVNYGAVTEVEDVKVNQSIPDNLLEFSFPKGTIVSDEMHGLKYTIEGVDQSPADKGKAGSEIAADTKLTAPVKEEQLRTVASKAEQMLQTLTAEQAVPLAIQIWPTIVLVTNDKYEYKLSATKSDGTKPVLLNYEFESGSLDLSSFKNLINDQNQLVLRINRKQSHTRFASGTLLLQLKGHDEVIKVTFVSPPLQDTP